MDGALLRDIALRTESICVPAGACAIDIGSIVAAHTGHIGDREAELQRTRRAEASRRELG